MERSGTADISFYPNIIDVEWKLEVLTSTCGSGADNLQYTSMWIYKYFLY